MRRIARSKLADEVQTQIRRGILTGRLRSGDPLSEPDLATRFGVSRAPVREALIALERDGLVEFIGGGRTRVISLDRGDFAEICTLRGSYERLAGRIVAERWNPSLAANLQDMIQLQGQSTTWSQLSALDMDFHEMIVAGSGHRRLLAAWRVLRSQCEACLMHLFGLETELGREPVQITVAAHERLIEALGGSHPDIAGDALAQHAESWMKWLDRAVVTAPVFSRATEGDLLKPRRGTDA